MQKSEVQLVGAQSKGLSEEQPRHPHGELHWPLVKGWGGVSQCMPQPHSQSSAEYYPEGFCLVHKSPVNQLTE